MNELKKEEEITGGIPEFQKNVGCTSRMLSAQIKRLKRFIACMQRNQICSSFNAIKFVHLSNLFRSMHATSTHVH